MDGGGDTDSDVDMDANVGRVEEELKQADVQDVCTVVGQVDSEVQGARIRQLVPPIQLRRGLRRKITLGEEIIYEIYACRFRLFL